MFIILSGEYPEKLVNIFIQRSMTLRKRSIEPLAFLFFLLFFLIYVGTTSNLVLCFFFVFCLDLRIFKRQLDHVCNRDFHGTWGTPNTFSSSKKSPYLESLVQISFWSQTCFEEKISFKNCDLAHQDQMSSGESDKSFWNIIFVTIELKTLLLL